ncbi:MAG: outer membrane beta-barrel protein [Spirochaetaceae bacterium]|jgi:hypothetical protein|nr:outer membrane beta-barrel protein [Spirochaetaceae bacterium]
MKKFFAALVCAAAVSAAQAAPKFGISAGGGAIFGPSWSKSSTENMNGFIYPATAFGAIGLGYKTQTFDVGGFVFGDFTYVEVSAVYLAQIGKAYEVRIKPVAGGQDLSSIVPAQDDQDYLNHIVIVDVLGKYPFAFGKSFNVFPAIGLGFKSSVAGNEYSDFSHDVLWGLSVKAGGGADYSLGQKLFLRGEVLFYFQVASDREANIAEFKDQGFTDVTRFVFLPEGHYMGHQFKLALGYKLI